VPVEFAVTELPTTAMDPDQHGRRVASFRQIEVAEQLHAIVLGEHDVGFDCDFLLFRHRTAPQRLPKRHLALVRRASPLVAVRKAIEYEVYAILSQDDTADAAQKNAEELLPLCRGDR
jgi:hypothetical protein